MRREYFVSVVTLFVLLLAPLGVAAREAIPDQTRSKSMGRDRAGAFANLVYNGDFEEPPLPPSSATTYYAPGSFPGWTVDAGSVDLLGLAYWQVASGNQSVDLNGNQAGAIYQDVATVPSTAYDLRFGLAGNPECPPSLKTLQVFWDQTLVVTLTFDTAGRTPAAMGWTTYRYIVTATTSSSRLKFASANDGTCGPVLDAVQLSPAAEYLTFLPIVMEPCLPAYFDGFSDPASGWPVLEDAYHTMGYANGEYRILVKPANWMAYTWLDVGVSDYRVEVDVRSAGQLGGGTGLIVGRTTAGYYLFEVSNGEFMLSRRDSGAGIWTTLIGWTPSPAVHGGSVSDRLKVVRTGASITLFANGQQLAAITDGTYTGNGVGMAADAYAPNFEGRFDNLVVYTGTCRNAPAGSLAANRQPSQDGHGMEAGAGSSQP